MPCHPPATAFARLHPVLPSPQAARPRPRFVCSRRQLTVNLPRPLGVVLEEVRPQRASQKRVVVVASVREDGPACGLVEVGDVVVATSATFGDAMWPAKSLDGAVSAIKSRCGDTVSLVLLRGEDQMTQFDVEVGEARVEDYTDAALLEGVQETERPLEKDEAGGGSRTSVGTPGVATAADVLPSGVGTGEDSVAVSKGEPERAASKSGDAQENMEGAKGTKATQVEKEDAGTTEPPQGPEEEESRGASDIQGERRKPDLPGGEVDMDPENVEELLEEFVKYRSRRVADCLVRRAADVVKALAVAPNPRASAIVSLYKRLKRAEAPLSLRFYNSLMWALAMAREPQWAVDVFDELPNPNVECYTTLAKAYSIMRLPDEALALLPAMRARGVTPNLYTYNAIIHCCVRAGDLGKARALFSEMTVDNVAPNTVSWNIILNWHARRKTGAERLAGIMQAFTDMKTSGVQPNTVSYTTMMKAYATSGAISKAEGIFNEMKKRFPVIRIDTEVYNTLLYAHSLRLDWRRCLELLDEMKTEDALDSSNAELLYGAPGRRSQNENVGMQTRDTENQAYSRSRYESNWRNDDKDSGNWKDDAGDEVKLPGRSDSAVNRGFGEFGAKPARSGVQQRLSGNLVNKFQVEPGEGEALSESQNGFSSSMSSSRNVLSNERFRVTESRVNVLDKNFDQSVRGMNSRQLKPNAVTYALVIKACGDAGHPQIAQSVFDEMLEDDAVTTPPAQALSSLLSSYAAVGNYSISVELLRRTREWGIVPTPAMLCSVMHACLEANEPDVALTVYAKLKASNMHEDVVARTMLLRAYGQRGEMDKAFNVLKGMLSNGSAVLPNIVTYNTLIWSAVAHGDTDLALRVLRMALDRSAPASRCVDSNTFKALVGRRRGVAGGAHRLSSGLGDSRRLLEGDSCWDGSDISGVWANVPTRAGEVRKRRIGRGEDALVEPGQGQTEAYGQSARRRLRYLRDAVEILRGAQCTPSGALYVALLEGCEMCEEWGMGMDILREREEGRFRVSREFVKEARLYEETMRGRASQGKSGIGKHGSSQLRKPRYSR